LRGTYAPLELFINPSRSMIVLKPPVRVFDPETRRLARRAIASEKRLERLDARHHIEAIRMLQKFELERAKDNANNLGNAWLKAVRKAGTHKADRRRERVKSKDLDRLPLSARRWPRLCACGA
jgi:hypothetical protein